MKLLLPVLYFSFLLTPFASYAESGSVVFLLDGSNSMWGRMNGIEKIVVARDVVAKAMADIPTEVSVGLAAYGHRNAKDCNDIEMILPLGKYTESKVNQALKSVVPRGMTPITGALKFVAETLKASDGPTHLVLVSDGKETCEGDPCATAAASRQSGAKLTVHVVGFNVSSEEQKQLECIASKGGGSYLEADSAEELTKALEKIQENVKEAVKKSKPPNAEDYSKPFWRIKSESKTFNGTLSKHFTLKDDPLIQLFNYDAVNISLVIDGKLSGSQKVRSATFAKGRGQVCRRVGDPDDFQINFKSKEPGWLSAEFRGKFACPDYSLMEVEGAFHIKVPQSLSKRGQ